MNNEFINIYTGFLKKILIPQRELKVVFDCSNGTAGLILKNLLKPEINPPTGGLKPIFLNEKPNGNFPAHGPNPLMSGALKQIQKSILKNKADFGAIFDADGDRVFFIDNLGRFVNPDIIARLLIWHLKPKKAIIDIRTGWQVRKPMPYDQQPTTSNQQLIISRVGHYFIKKMMRKVKADFGAEYSGHYYFRKFFYTDSGILAAIETINAISKLPYKFSDFIDLLPQYYRSGELNFKVRDKEKLIKFIEKKYKNNSAKISKLDGLTMEFKNYWFNLRPSNTEPLIRLNIEATSKKLLNQKIKEFKKLFIVQRV